jgi:hypothetical protein
MLTPLRFDMPSKATASLPGSSLIADSNFFSSMSKRQRISIRLAAGAGGTVVQLKPLPGWGRDDYKAPIEADESKATVLQA